MNKKPGLVQKLLICGFFATISTQVQAQITPDSTLRGEASKITPNVIINGANADLINGGAQRGNNLFHSFTEFNIKEGQGVYFANPSGVVNILTRVTGSNASNILGTLGVDGAANLFLINPNGILFGRNASLDVRGSFAGTTANGIQFGNQGNFSATEPEAPGLLTINPSALFFNQINPNAAIQNNSVAPAGVDLSGVTRLGLRVPDGKSLLLVGGNVNLDNGRLNALGGRVELGGLAEVGNVNLFFDGNNLKLGFPENVTRGSVSLTNQARVFVQGDGGGDIAVNAQNIEILGGSFLSGGIGQGLGAPETVAGDILLNATGEIKIADSGSAIANLVRSGSKGNGGNISIDAGSFKLQDGTLLSASTAGKGNAGNVKLTATDAISLAGYTGILSTVEAGGVGKGGNIDINARTLTLQDGAQLQTITRSAELNQPPGKGDAGNVNVTVTNVVDIVGVKDGRSSGISSSVQTGTEGNGGNITINAGSFLLRDGAQLSASTSGIGNAGNVIVNATGAVSLVDAGIYSTVEAGGVGKGGNIDINAATLTLRDSAQLQTITSGAESTQPPGKGDAGNVNVKVIDVVDITGVEDGRSTGIFSSVEKGTEGNGGNITIDASSFKLQEGARLSASTSGIGNAGNVNVKAIDAVDITGVKNGLSSAIYSSVETGAKGNGGNITVDAGSFFLRDGAFLFASTSGIGNAGNVTVNATGAVTSAGNTRIFSTVEAGGTGKGGNIDINAATLSLQDDAQLLTFTRGASNTKPAGKGDAGNVNVKVAGVVDITGEQNGFRSGISSFVDTGTEGNGGNIIIDASFFKLGNGAKLAASTLGQGNAGNVRVSATDTISLVSANIFSTVEAGGVGKGGNIDINAATLLLQDGAQLATIVREASDTQGAGKGDAGNVNVKVTGVVEITSIKNGFLSGIFSSLGKGTEGSGGNITIDAGLLKLENEARLTASTLGKGDAGNVTVTASDAVSLVGKTAISSAVEVGGIGKGGNIDINTATLSIRDGARLNASTLGKGDAGNVTVTASDAVSLVGKTAIFSAVETDGIGKGGNININAATLSLRDGAQLIASTSGKGNAGNVTVTASDTISLVGNTAILSTVGAGGVGKGGNININAATLSLRDGSQLATGTRSASLTQRAGKGDAGDVNVKVIGEVDIADVKNGFLSGIASFVEKGTEGNGGNITIDAGSFKLRDGAQLSASTFAQGNAGSVMVSAKDVVTISGISKEEGFSSALFTITYPNSTGKGGNIAVNTNIFHISDGAILDARTQNNNSGGNITVNANVFEAIKGGQLSTITSSNGRAGKITVNATDKVFISSNDPNYYDNLNNLPDTVQPIGANAGFFVNSTGSGTTGDIEINSPNIILDNQGKIQANSVSGNGGNINLKNNDLLLLRRGAQISTNAGTEQKGGDGGNIDIYSRFIVAVPKENSDITANAFTGRGGNVNIRTQGIFGIEPRVIESLLTSDITASSENGVQGQISITQPDVQPAQGLIELPEEVVDATRRVAQICPRQPGAKPLGEFTITGRGSLPPSPLEALPGTTSNTKLATLDNNNTNVLNIVPSKAQNIIVEAQGWVKNVDGNMELVATAPVTTANARVITSGCPS